MSGELGNWADMLDLLPFLGWLVPMAAALTFSMVGFAIVAGPRARTLRGRVFALGPAIFLTSGSFAGLVALISFERRLYLDIVTGAVEADWLFRPVVREQHWLALLGALLVLAMPLTIVALTRVARSRRELGYAAAFVTWVAGVAVSVELLRVREVLTPSTHEAHDRAAYFRAAFAEASMRIDLSAWVIASAAALSLFVVATRLRSRRPLTRGATLGACLVFALGAIAFAGTRGHAHDRHHPVSLVPDPPIADELVAFAPDWVEECAPLEPAPVLDLLAVGGAQIDGRRIHVGELREHIEMVRRNASLLSLLGVLSPPEPDLRSLTIIASPDMPTQELREWLSEAHAGGLWHAQFVFRVHAVVSTDTLGDVDVPRHCGVGSYFAACEPAARPRVQTPATVGALIEAAHAERVTFMLVDARGGVEDLTEGCRWLDSVAGER